MKYIIKINKKSIKQNPNAGRTVFQIPCAPTRIEHDDGSYTITRDIRTVRSIYPEPDYLFNYMPKIIQCEYCKEKFNWSKLYSDSIDDNYVENICPKCNIGNCCELEFEELKEGK